MRKQSKVYVRMSLYIGITALITFVTLIDSFTNEQIEVFTDFDWFKIAFKSFIPSLVSLKAYLDSTVHDTSSTLISVASSTTSVVQNNTETLVTKVAKPKRLPRAN